MTFVPQIDSPMFIVTCAHGHERAGCLVGFATQCSIVPARFLVCLSTANHTYAVAQSANGLAVHVLSQSSHEKTLASSFGEKTGDEVDKFAGVAWHEGRTGAPILEDCHTRFEGSIVAKVPFGDHVGFVLAPIDDVDATESLETRQLALRDVESFEAGHPSSSKERS